MRSRILALSAFLIAACNSAPSTSIATFSDSFEECAVGGETASMEQFDTGPSIVAAQWKAQQGGAGTSGRSLLASAPRSTGEQFHLLLTDSPIASRDVNLSVRVFANGGREDQGGGLVWRAQNQSNYYVTRWNPLEDNVRIYHVKDGVRTMLQTAKVIVEPGAWHLLAVRALGGDLRVMFDGKEILAIEDTTFGASGKAGLWTKADAATAFDDFAVSPLVPGRR
jgi:hypothetical protein